MGEQSHWTVESTGWIGVAKLGRPASMRRMKSSSDRLFGVRPAVLGRDEGPWLGIDRCLVLAPHPDDFDVVAVTLRHLVDAGAELFLEVLTSGASGVEDAFVEGWKEKAVARELEQIASCSLFGLSHDKLRFHRLTEDADGHMLADDDNKARVWGILDRVQPDSVILPHGSDSNADHRRTFRMFEEWANKREGETLALLVRDPKTLEMNLDLVTCFDQGLADWKAEMLRCHASQHERNLRSRGYGIDVRVLQVNRDIASELGNAGAYAEGFEVRSFKGA